MGGFRLNIAECPLVNSEVAVGNREQHILVTVYVSQLKMLFTLTHRIAPQAQNLNQTLSRQHQAMGTACENLTVTLLEMKEAIVMYMKMEFLCSKRHMAQLDILAGLKYSNDKGPIS